MVSSDTDSGSSIIHWRGVRSTVLMAIGLDRTHGYEGTHYWRFRGESRVEVY